MGLCFNPVPASLPLSSALPPSLPLSAFPVPKASLKALKGDFYPPQTLPKGWGLPCTSPRRWNFGVGEMLPLPRRKSCPSCTEFPGSSASNKVGILEFRIPSGADPHFHRRRRLAPSLKNPDCSKSSPPTLQNPPWRLFPWHPVLPPPFPSRPRPPAPRSPRGDRAPAVSPPTPGAGRAP